MFNRYADKKCTAATQLANMMLEMSIIRLKPIYEAVRKSEEINPADWKVISEITGVLKIIAPFGEDEAKPVGDMTNEELQAYLTGLMTAPVPVMDESNGGDYESDDE